jgi:hypothetical protein
MSNKSSYQSKIHVLSLEQVPVINTPASYLGFPGLELRMVYRLSLLKIFVVFLAYLSPQDVVK